MKDEGERRARARARLRAKLRAKLRARLGLGLELGSGRRVTCTAGMRVPPPSSSTPLIITPGSKAASAPSSRLRSRARQSAVSSPSSSRESGSETSTPSPRFSAVVETCNRGRRRLQPWAAEAAALGGADLRQRREQLVMP